MTDSPRCREFRDTAPELAFGIASGDERARALEHLTTCADCRRELDQLSAVSDELMLLAPEREPPLGFETRVADRLGRRPRGRTRMSLVVAAAMVIGAALSATAVYSSTADDRELADSYRHTLDVADGTYMGAWPLDAMDGETAGTVFGYEGARPWIFMTFDTPPGFGSYECRIVTVAGEELSLGRYSGRRSSWGAALPVDLEAVTAVRVYGPRGPVLEADVTN